MRSQDGRDQISTTKIEKQIHPSISFMIRCLFAICSVYLSLHDASGITTEALRPFRFAEVKRVREVNGLPPKLMVVIDLIYNEKLVTVVRHDETNPMTGTNCTWGTGQRRPSQQLLGQG
jgi:hypothetical protein